MIIRTETPADIDAIYALTATAFAHQPFSDGSEPDIINRLRDAGGLRFSFVAERDGQILGHVALSPVAIKGQSKDETRACWVATDHREWLRFGW
jgi:putative acetyltransferase